jgi:hypothetical protein
MTLEAQTKPPFMSNPSTRSNVAITILTFALIICLIVIIYLFISRSAASRRGPRVTEDAGHVSYGIRPINDKVATADVIRFRALPISDSGPISFGIYYTADEIRTYLDSVYPKVVAAEIQYLKGQSRDWSAYEWKVGCYWMLRTDRDGIPKTDFCFVPTLVSKTNKYDALEYFVNDSAFYTHDIDISIPGVLEGRDSSRSPGFNTGTMFP